MPRFRSTRPRTPRAGARAASTLLLAVVTSVHGAVAQGGTAADDGPHLFHTKQGVVAKWVRDGEVESERFASGDPIVLPRFAALIGERLELERHRPDEPVHALPERLFVLSDVEGEYDHLLRFLKNNRVVDADGRWAYGKGHLVTVGDMVDRGTKVTETLWLLYRLSREARRAGGRVHFVLGNHEVMVMGGDVRYAAPKYEAVAKRLGVSVAGLFGADTEIGRWLRARNCVVRIGGYVFVHAGLSPAVATERFDYDAINEAMRAVLGVPPDRIRNRNVLALSWGRYGPLWYRGYFPRHAADFGPTPTAGDVARILEHVGGTTIVVGHTKVGRVTPLFDGRVIAIDIPWTNPDRVRALSIRGERIDVVDIEGRRSPFAPAPQRRSR